MAKRFKLEQLTVNYRTPAEIAAVADDVLAAIDPTLAAAAVGPGDGRAAAGGAGRRRGAVLADAVAAVLADEAAGRATGDGRRRGRGAGGAGRRAGADRPGGRAARAGAPGRRAATAPGTPDLDAPVVVLPVSAAKGLEFDAVVLVEPAELVAESPRGLNDLYVALTRATQRLTVVHRAPLPPVLHRLGE